MKRLIAGLSMLGLLAFAGCGDDDSTGGCPTCAKYLTCCKAIAAKNMSVTCPDTGASCSAGTDEQKKAADAACSQAIKTFGAAMDAPSECK